MVMKMPKVVAVFFVVFILSSMESYGVDIPNMTLEDCVIRGIAVSHRVAEEQHKIKKSDSEIGIARSRLFPRVTVQLGITRLGSISSIGPSDPDYLDQDIVSNTVQLRETLFAGGSLWNEYMRTKLSKELTELELQQTIMQLVLDIQTTFLGFLKAKEEMYRLEQSLARLDKNVAIAKAFFKEGLVSKADLLQAEVDREEIRQQLERAKTDVSTYRKNLNSLLDFPLDAKVNYVGRLRDFPLNIPFSLKECVERGLREKPEIRLVKKSIEIAKKDVNVVLGEMLPRLDATASYVESSRDYKEPGVIMGIPYDRDQTNHYWSVGLQLQWSLGVAGEELHRLKFAKREIARLRERLKEIKRAVRVEIENQYLRVKEARKRIDIAEKTVDLAMDAYKQAEERFKEGVGSLIHLLDAQIRLTRSEASRNQAYLDFQVALARLYNAMGIRNDSLLIEARKYALGEQVK